MAEFTIEVNGVSVGAPNLKGLHTLLDDAALIEKLKALAPIAPIVQRATRSEGASVSSGAYDPEKGGPNCEIYSEEFLNANGSPKRFRMTNEERDLYGTNRERAAYERLKKLGLRCVEVALGGMPTVAPGIATGAPREGDKIDPFDIVLDED